MNVQIIITIAVFGPISFTLTAAWLLSKISDWFRKLNTIPFKGAGYPGNKIVYVGPVSELNRLLGVLQNPENDTEQITTRIQQVFDEVFILVRQPDGIYSFQHSSCSTLG